MSKLQIRLILTQLTKDTDAIPCGIFSSFLIPKKVVINVNKFQLQNKSTSRKFFKTEANPYKIYTFRLPFHNQSLLLLKWKIWANYFVQNSSDLYQITSKKALFLCHKI